jgi:hypothetical protein
VYLILRNKLSFSVKVTLPFFDDVQNRLFGPIQAYFAIIILTKVRGFLLLVALRTDTWYRARKLIVLLYC